MDLVFFFSFFPCNSKIVAKCEYMPEEEGEYKVLVLLGGFHVPGSV